MNHRTDSGSELQSGQEAPMSDALSLSERLRKHVNDRGGPSIENGAWQMMLEAADCIDQLERALTPFLAGTSVNHDGDTVTYQTTQRVQPSVLSFVRAHAAILRVHK